MVQARKVEEACVRIKARDGKKIMSFEKDSSKSRVEIQDKPRFKERFSNQVPSMFPKTRDEKVTRKWELI